MSNTLSSNCWYYLYYGDSSTSKYAVQAFDINNSGSGAIIGNPLNATTNQNAFQWQILPVGLPDTYVVRSRSLGNQWTIGTFWQPVAGLPGMDTRIRSENYKSPAVVPKSALWIIKTTGDGTGLYYVSNVQNGTGFHLDSNSQGTIYLRDASTGSFTNGMKWAFSSVSAINDQQWSYTPTSTSTSATSTSTTTTSSLPASNTASTTPTSTVSPSQRSPNLSNKGMSIGIIASAVAAGLAFTLLILGAIFFYYRRRKQRRNQGNSPYNPYDAKMELEGRPIYPPQPQLETGEASVPVFTYSAAMHRVKSYEKVRSPLDEKHPAHRQWENATELPTEPSVTASSRSEGDKP